MISVYTYPYSETAGQSGQPNGYTVSIDGIGYLVDTAANTPYNETWHRSSVDVLNSQQNAEEDGGSLLPPEVWRRSQSSWHHGAGQKIADRKTSDPYRFESSTGVNVWDKFQISLLHDTEIAKEAAGSIVGVVVDDIAVVAIGTDLYLIRDTPANPAEEWAVGTVTPGSYKLTTALSAPAVDAATDGKYAWFVTGTTLYRVSPTYGITTVSTVTLPFSASMIEFCNGYMIAGVNGSSGVNAVLYDISAITASSPLAIPGSWTVSSGKIGETLGDVTWKGACDGKGAMFVLGGKGARYGVYTVTIQKGASVTLTPPVRVADLPTGERGHSIYSYLGYIMIGTSRGVRFATADSEQFVYGPLIDVERPVKCFHGQDRFVWFGWSDYEGRSGLGRLDMSEFVSDLLPSYASDIMADVAGEVTWVGSVYGRLLFGVAGSGVFREKDTYVEQGHVTTSAWTFGVVDQKIGFYAQATTSPLVGFIELEASIDDATYGAGGSALPGEVMHRFPLGGQKFTTAKLTVTLSRGTPTEASLLKGIEIRATYVRGSATEWRVPILIRDAYELPTGTTESRDVLLDYAHLFSLVETGRPFIYAEGDNYWQVFATGFIWTPVEESSVKFGYQGQFTLIFREVV